MYEGEHTDPQMSTVDYQDAMVTVASPMSTCGSME
jgi:hypothetical protein